MAYGKYHRFLSLPLFFWTYFTGLYANLESHITVLITHGLCLVEALLLPVRAREGWKALNRHENGDDMLGGGIEAVVLGCHRCGTSPRDLHVTWARFDGGPKVGTLHLSLAWISRATSTAGRVTSMTCTTCYMAWIDCAWRILPFMGG